MKPTRYTGGELNSVIKNPADVDVRFGFCFADTYEIAMSHLGLKILYHTLNNREDTYCERVFAPWTDMDEPESFAEWLAEFGGGKLILGADIRDGAVAVQGWTERSEMTAQELIARFAPQGLAQVICTDIARDGMLCGTSAEFYAGLQGQFPGVEITVSGGIASMTDIEALDGAGLRSVIVGKALYEGRITLEELKRCLPNA